jgi:predicted Na+-dependent transporter
MKLLDWLEDFYYKYYSESTIPKLLWVRYLTAGIMMVPFVLGLFGTMIGWVDLVRVSTYIFLAMLIPFVIGGFIVHFYHNYKIKQINKRWR